MVLPLRSGEEGQSKPPLWNAARVLATGGRAMPHLFRPAQAALGSRPLVWPISPRPLARGDAAGAFSRSGSGRACVICCRAFVAATAGAKPNVAELGPERSP